MDIRVSEEIELKLSLSAEALAAMPKALKARGVSFARPVKMVTTYYDTAKGALEKKGVFLRLRVSGGGVEQTVKTAGEGGVLARRGEWNWPLKAAVPDLDLAASTGLKALEKRARKGGVAARYASEIARRVAVVKLGSATLELALDSGQVRAGNRTSPVRELEIEVKSGDPAAVYALARDLLNRPGVSIGFATKASRGIALAKGAAERCVRAREPQLAPHMTPEAAAAAILEDCAAHAAGNLQILGETGAAEAIHQARVALRRLRAALVLLKDAIPPERRHHLRREAGWLAGEMSAVRDLDVLSLGALKAATPPESLVKPYAALKRAVERARRAARTAAARAAASPRAQHLLLDLSQTAAALVSTGEGGLAHLAAEQLERRHQAVIAAGEGVESAGVEARHRLRLALKKMRYAADFFAPLFPRKAVKAELKALARLQDSLGAFNDAAMAPHVAARAAHGADEGALAFLAGWAAHRAEAAWAEAAGDLARFRKAEPFWREAL
jgi:inorganic triphosphatase YgiF